MKVVRTDRPGIALLVVLLVTLAVAAIAAGSALIGANSLLIDLYDQHSSLLESVADAGLELGRARLNANPALYSDDAVATLERDAAVYDADGHPIAGVIRTVYVLPIGGGPGEYGNFAALVSIARDGSGTTVIRRRDLLKESFSSYGYFTDIEPPNYQFANQDNLYGPVHSNSNIQIGSSGAVFHGSVTTAGSFVGAEYAQFLDDTTSHVNPIAMPSESHIDSLAQPAALAGLSFTAPAGAHESGEATMRIEFVARDVDGDGVKEGFIRIFDAPGYPWYVVADVPPRSSAYTEADSMAVSPNCGHYEDDRTFNVVSATGDALGHTASQVLNDGTDSRCFLGGDSTLLGAFPGSDPRGAWRPYGGSIDPSVADEYDAGYLFPIERKLNPAFRGVIFVDGDVVVSGTVRGRVTLAAHGKIIIGDDVLYANGPGSATCEDILGLLATDSVIVADNTLNAPRRAPGINTYTKFDDSQNEVDIDASILSLRSFTAERYNRGATTASSCGTDAYGNPVPWGRGCLVIEGGLVQQQRGAVAIGSVSGGGTGFIKRYTYDTCARTDPPPYFPGTGHFWKSRYYEVDPVGFDIEDYFDALN